MDERDITVGEMLDAQRALQAANAGRWTPMIPEHGRSSLLWAVEELGELAAIIKKQGDKAIMADAQVRAHFTEELCDVLMYLGDVCLCYDIPAEAIASAFRGKHERNLHRDYLAEYEGEKHNKNRG